MLRLTKSILAAICYWFLTLALLFSLPNGFPVIAGVAIYLFLPIAVILLVFTLIAFIKERRKRWSICGALILGVSFLAFEPLLYWGALAHWCLNHQAYKTTAARMLAAQDDAQRRDICGEECWLITTDHSRIVAFHYAHGFLNWHDIIYDPSGKVLALNSWPKKAI